MSTVSYVVKTNGSVFTAKTAATVVGGGGAAEDITFTPGGTISATNVQDAIEEVAAEGGGGGGVSDGDKGDITVSNTGATWTLDQVVTTSKVTAASLVTEAEGLASSDNDTSWPTTAAVVDAIATHTADTTSVHGIADTSVLETTTGAQTKVDTHVNDTSAAHAASAISIVDSANDFTATDVEGALAELQSDHETDAQNLADHIADTSDAHDASAISILDSANDFTATNVEDALAELQTFDESLVSGATPLTAAVIPIADSGDDFTATDVEGALAELQSDAEAHVNDTSAAHAASAISYAGGTGMSATDVEAAIDELANEKANLASPTFTGDVVVPDADAATEAMNRQTSDGRYLLKSFGTTTQTISNTQGRRITIENETDFASGDISFNLYLDNDDAEPAFQMRTAAGVLGVFQMGPGGSTAPDTPLVRRSWGVLGCNSRSAQGYAFPGRFVLNTTAVGNVGTGEDTLQTYTLAAGTLESDGQGIRARFAGTIANNANAKRIRLKFGSTTLLDTGALTTGAAYDWSAEVFIVRTGAATQKAIARLWTNDNTTDMFVDYTAPTETMSNALAVFATGEAVSNNDITSEILTVDYEPDPS